MASSQRGVHGKRSRLWKSILSLNHGSLTLSRPGKFPALHVSVKTLAPGLISILTTNQQSTAIIVPMHICPQRVTASITDT